MRWIVMLALVACGNDSGGGDPKDAAPTDDSQNPGPDSSTTPDASFGPGAVCGATTCPVNEGCCTGATISCKTTADCPTQHFACDGAEDCSGGVCCFGNGGQGGSECRPAGTNCDVACHIDNDCGGATPKCCPRAFSPSYGVCLATCP